MLLVSCNYTATSVKVFNFWQPASIHIHYTIYRQQSSTVINDMHSNSKQCSLKEIFSLNQPTKTYDFNMNFLYQCNDGPLHY